MAETLPGRCDSDAYRLAMFVVGFDLDMTLVDPRVGVRASLNALKSETGVPIDADVVLTRLGPKLEDELAYWFPAADVPAMVARYRELYWDACVDGGSKVMPGAHEAIAAVRAESGSVLIVTAKAESHARRCLEEVGLRYDAIVGWAHGNEKTHALVEHRALIYVGDTIADIEAGVSACTTAVGVATGMHNAAEMYDAGADVVLESLTEFPAWLAACDVR
jgi:phosphoglycolate phosphatase